MEEFRDLKQKGPANREEGHMLFSWHETKEFGGLLERNNDIRESGDAAAREDMLRTFIINRFLPAAKAVTTGYENSATSIRSDGLAAAASFRESQGKKRASSYLSSLKHLHQSPNNASCCSLHEKKLQDICSGHSTQQPRGFFCLEQTLSSSFSTGSDSSRHDSKESVTLKGKANVCSPKEKQPTTVKPISIASSSTDTTTLSSSSSTGYQPRRDLTSSFSLLNNCTQCDQFEKSDGVQPCSLCNAYQDANISGNVPSQQENEISIAPISICLSNKHQRIKFESNLGEQQQRIQSKPSNCSMKTVAMNSDEDEAMFYDASSKLIPSQSMLSATCERQYDEPSVDWQSNLTGMVSHGLDLSETSESSTQACKPRARDAGHMKGSLKSSGSNLCERFTKHLTLETVGSAEPNHEAHISQNSRNSPPGSSARSFVPPIFPRKCQLNDIGWPFGISKCRDTADKPHQTEKLASLSVSSPPLPPSPSKGSWLEKAIASSASNPSPLFTLQQNEKLSLLRKKLDILQPAEEILAVSVSATSARSKVEYKLTNKEKPNDCNKTPSSARKNSDFISMLHKSKLSLLQWKQKSPSTKKKQDSFTPNDETMVHDLKPLPIIEFQKRDRPSSTARRKLDFVTVEQVAHVKWEDIVKGSKRNPGKEDHHQVRNFHILGPLQH